MKYIARFVLYNGVAYMIYKIEFEGFSRTDEEAKAYALKLARETAKRTNSTIWRDAEVYKKLD